MKTSIFPLAILMSLLAFRGASQCPTYTVPHFESFESIASNNTLPSCWSATSFSNSTLTFTSTTPFGTPHSGSKYAAFSMTATGTQAFYSPGFQLYSGAVYSVSLWHTLGSMNNVPQNSPTMSIMVGSSQSTVGMTSLTTAACGQINYTALTSTFTVGNNGVYYLGIVASVPQATNNNLTWDDFMITIPCIPANQPVVTFVPGSATVCGAGTPATFTVNVTSSGMSTSSVITYTSNATAQFSLPVTNTLTGCSSVGQATLVVIQTPNPGMLMLPNSICKGSSGILTLITSPPNHTLLPPSPGSGNTYTLKPTASQVYTLIVDYSGCIVTNTLLVQVHPTPTVVLTASQYTVCASTQVNLTATGGLVYNWLGGITGVSGTVAVTPTQTSVYQVIGVDINACRDTASVQVVVDPCVGMANHAESELRVYPNPAADHLYVEGNFDRLELRNALGELVLFNGTTNRLELGHLPAGIYLLSGFNGQKVSATKILKE